MNKCRYGETEYGNSNAESITVGIDHFVMALHGTQRRFNYRAAGVLVLFARRDKWLDANHSFALDFGFTAIAIGDQPVTPQQLHWRSPQIAYGYGISKNVTFIIR